MLQRTDVSRREDAKQLIEATVDQFGRLDILVNNAGLQHVAPIQDFPEEKWDLLIGVMLTGAFLLSKYAFAQMMRQSFGRIINIASAHGLVASPYKAAYVWAKHGLLGLTKVLAMEGAAHNITAVALCLGLRAHAVGGVPDRRSSQGAWHLGARSHGEGVARRKRSSGYWSLRKSRRSWCFCAAMRQGE